LQHQRTIQSLTHRLETLDRPSQIGLYSWCL